MDFIFRKRDIRTLSIIHCFSGLHYRRHGVGFGDEFFSVDVAQPRANTKGKEFIPAKPKGRGKGSAVEWAPGWKKQKKDRRPVDPR